MDAVKKKDVVLRLSRLKTVSGDVINTLAKALRERVREWGQDKEQPPVGLDALSEILKSAPIGFSSRIIEELAEDNPDLGQTLKERLYSTDDVCRAQDRVIAEKLSCMTEGEIAMLLKGRPDNFKQKILSNVSQGRGALIVEEGQIMGVVLREDADVALREFLDWFGEMREKGRILYMDDDGLLR
jgi:flagellar motor switch protein FliG